MRFSFLAVLAALTASMYVSATPSVFSRDCRAVGKTCEQGSDCCSDACAYKSDCSGKVCIDDDSIHGMQELARREIWSWLSDKLHFLLRYPSIERDRYTYVSILHTIISRYPFRPHFVLSHWQPTPPTSNQSRTILFCLSLSN
ncbi:hypothetical protein EDB19DRAFT_471553 [Suillus lakei]|nr:hypothetical protein EDB19DRAFT_471553 [Suillus lakei]